MSRSPSAERTPAERTPAERTPAERTPVGERAGPATARHEAILDAATQVFLRYGFRKTSMDDLARAAGLSRQGLYLHFATKDALFRESLLRLIATTLADARAALARTDQPVAQRLLAAFEAAHGHAIGTPGSGHMTELLETSVALVGPVVAEMEAQLTDAVRELLESEGVAARWAGAGLSAAALAEQLYLTSFGIKHRVTTRDEYLARLRTAVTMLCTGAPAAPPSP